MFSKDEYKIDLEKRIGMGGGSYYISIFHLTIKLDSAKW